MEQVCVPFLRSSSEFNLQFHSYAIQTQKCVFVTEFSILWTSGPKVGCKGITTWYPQHMLCHGYTTTWADRCAGGGIRLKKYSFAQSCDRVLLGGRRSFQFPSHHFCQWRDRWGGVFTPFFLALRALRKTQVFFLSEYPQHKSACESVHVYVTWPCAGYIT